MKKQNTSEWIYAIGAVAMTVGLWLLKIGAFLAWVCLSGVSILLKHFVDALKKWIFPKD